MQYVEFLFSFWILVCFCNVHSTVVVLATRKNMSFCTLQNNLYWQADSSARSPGYFFPSIFSRLYTYCVRHEFLPILKNKNYAKTAHFWACAKRYKYFEHVFVLLQAWFGSSTSSNIAKKDDKMKKRQILQNAPLRQPHLRQGLTKCRDRHRQARPIISAPFWAITSSFCDSISLFLSLPPFFHYRHRLRPVHKRADRLERPHFGLIKGAQKQ